MKYLLVSSINRKLIVRADDGVIDQLYEHSFLKQYIPESEIQKVESDEASLPHLLLTQSDTTEFSFSEQIAEIKGDIPNSISLHDIVTVIDYCLDYSRQKNAEYCLHGSAVASQAGQGVYFLGPVSGLGKTTTAINLCLDRAFKFVADEKLVINENGDILGGIKHVSYNKTSLQNSIRVNVSGKSEKELSDHLAIESEPVSLKLVILPIVIQGSTLDCESWDKKKAEFHIYEEMTRKIRGTSRRIENFTFPLQSIDSLILSKRRVKSAKKIADLASFYVIRGEVKQIMDKIEELLREQSQ